MREFEHIITDLKQAFDEESDSRVALIEDLKEIILDTPSHDDLQLQLLLDGGITEFCCSVSGLQEFEKAKCNCLDILQLTLDSGFNENLKYIEKLKVICFRLYRQDLSSKVQCKCISFLIHMSCRYSSHIRFETAELKKWVNCFFNVCQKDRQFLLQSKLLEFLGIIYNKFASELDQTSAKLIAELLPAKLESQLRTQGGKPPELNIVTGSLRGLNQFLKGSSSEDEKISITKRIYPFVRMVLDPLLKYTRRDAPRASLDLMKTHGPLLSENLWTDCCPMYNTLLHWCNSTNREDRNAGLSAMDSYIITIAKVLSKKNTNDEVAASNVLFLIDQYNNVNLENADGVVARILSKGYGILASSCSHFLGKEEIKFIFRAILKTGRASFLQSNEKLEVKLSHLPYHVESLGLLMKNMPEMYDKDLDEVLQLVLGLVRHFPDIPETEQFHVYTSIFTVLHSFSGKKRYQSAFYRKMIDQSLTITCRQNIVPNEPGAPWSGFKKMHTNYKSYVPLWRTLIDADANTKDFSTDYFESIQKELVELVVVSLPSYTRSLVLNSKIGNEMLRNISGLMADVLPRQLKKKSSENCLERIIQYSNEIYPNPCLHRLIKTLLSRIFKSKKQQPEDFLMQVLSKYMRILVQHCTRFQGEQFYSSLIVIFEMPGVILKTYRDDIVPIMKIGLDEGLYNQEIGMLCIQGLTQWSHDLDQEVIEQMFPDIMPKLLPYLRFKEPPKIDIEARAFDILTKKGRCKKSYDINRSSTSKDVEDKTRRLMQILIIKLLSSLDSKVASTIVPPVNYSERNFKIDLDIPFPGAEMSVNFGILLPRIVELSTLCRDQETRQAACSLLHKFCIIEFGNDAMDFRPHSETGSSFFISHLGTLLLLACDPDSEIRSQFHDFVLESIHWVMSFKSYSPQRLNDVLQAILNGLCKNNCSLSILCERCLVEFFVWASKKPSDDFRKIVKMMVTKLKNMFRSSCEMQRKGACLAWKSVAPKFGTESSFVEEFLVSIFRANLVCLERTECNYCVNLDLCHISLNASIVLFKQFAHFFMGPSSTFVDEDNSVSYPGLIFWLLDTAQTVSSFVRGSLFIVAEKLSHLTEWNNLEEFAAEHIDCAEKVVEIAEKNLKTNRNIYVGDLERIEHDDLIKHLQDLHCTVDFYTFLLKKMNIPLSVCEHISSRFFEMLSSFYSMLLPVYNQLASQYAMENTYDQLPFLNHSSMIMIKVVTLATHNYNLSLYKAPFLSWEPFREIICHMVFTSFIFDNRYVISVVQDFLTADRLLEDETEDFEFLKRRLNALLMEAYREDRCKIDQLLNQDNLKPAMNLVKVVCFLQRTNCLRRRMIIDMSADFFGCLHDFMFRYEGNNLIAVDLNLSDLEPVMACLQTLTLGCSKSRSILFKRIFDTTPATVRYGETTTKGVHFLKFFTRAAVKIAFWFIEEFKFRPTQLPLCHIPLMQQMVRVLEENLYIREMYSKKWIENFFIRWMEAAIRESKSDEDAKESLINLLLDVFDIAEDVMITHMNASVSSHFIFCMDLLRGSDTKLSTKLVAVKMVPHLLKLDSHRWPITSSLQNFVATHIPADREELQIGSPKEKEAHEALMELLVVFNKTKDHLITELIINIYCVDDCQRYDDLLSETLKHVMNTSTLNQLAMLQAMMKLFLEAHRSISNRFRVLEKFMIPCLHHSENNTLVNFFSDNIITLMSCVDWHPEKTVELTTEELAYGIAALKLLEVMFEKLESADIQTRESKIVQAFQPNGTDPKVLMKTALRISKPLIKRKWPETFSSEVKDLRRLCSCAAYNTTLKILRKANQKSGLFISIFCRENTSDFRNTEDIFGNIIDTSLSYNCDTRETIKKDALDQNIDLQSSTSAASKDTSSNEMPGQFDFTDSVVITETQVSESSKTERKTISRPPEKRLGNYNNHEVMENLSKTMEFLWQSELKHAHESDLLVTENHVPEWIQFFVHKLEYSPSVHTKQFIICLICKIYKVFETFAIVLTPSLIKCIIHGVTGTGITIFTKDLLLVILSWDINWSRTILSSVNSEIMKVLLKRLVMNSPHVLSRDFMANITMVTLFVNSLKLNLIIDYDCILDLLLTENGHKREQEAGLLISKALIAHMILPFPAENVQSRKTFCNTMVKFFTNSSDRIACLAAETLGQCIKYFLFKNETDVCEEICLMVKGSYDDMEYEQFLSVLYSLQKFYGDVIDDFAVDFLINILPKLHGVPRERACECLVIRSSYMEDPSILLRSLNIKEMLAKRDSSTQLAALKIVKYAIKELSVEELWELLPFIVESIGHRVSSCRKLVYDILIFIYETNKDKIGDIEEKLATKSQDLLIMAVNDDECSLRYYILQFWKKSAQRMKISDRIIYLFEKLRMSSGDSSFLTVASHVLLDPVIGMLAYEEPIVAFPLVRAVRLCPNEQGYSSQDDDMNEKNEESSMNFEQLLDDEQEANLIPKSQQAAITNKSSLSSPQEDNKNEIKVTAKILVATIEPFHQNSSTTGDVNTFPQKEKRKNRYKDKKNVRFVKRQESTKKLKEIIVNKRKKQRELQITLNRTYNVEDFPDIQISYKSIFAPLRDLAERDSFIASRLISILVLAVRDSSEFLVSTDSNTFDDEIQETVQQMFQIEGHDPHILYLCMEICREADIMIEPEYIKNVCLQNNQELEGISMLNQQLQRPSIYKVSGSYDGSKNCSENIPALKKQSIWLSLAELFKSLGLWEVVSGIVSNEVRFVAPETRIALAHESVMDYGQACKKYYEALSKGSEVPPSEKAFWQESYVKSAEELALWPEIDHFIKAEYCHGNPPSIMTWSHPRAKSFIIPKYVNSRAMIEILSKSQTSELQSFIQGSWNNLDHATFLEKELSLPLALYFLGKSENKLAEVFTNAAVSSFITRISNCSRLNTKSLMSCVEEAALLGELLNFVDIFVKNSHMQTSVDQWNNLELTNMKNSVNNSKFHQWRAVSRTVFSNYVQREHGHIPMRVLHESVHWNNMTLIKWGLEKNNFALVKNHILHLEKDHEHCSIQESLSFAKSKMILGEGLRNSGCNQSQSALRAWRALIEPLPTSINTVEYNNTVKDICMMLCHCSRDISSTPLLTTKQSDFLRSKIPNLNVDSKSSLSASLLDFSLIGLKNACLNRQESRKAHENLSKFCEACLDQWSDAIKHEEYTRLLMVSVIRGMARGCAYSHYQFGRCLNILKDNVDLSDDFTCEIESVPTWMFLLWVEQIILNIDIPAYRPLDPILFCLAQEYPQAIVYSFLANLDHICGQSNSGDLHSQLTTRFKAFPLIECFIEDVQEIPAPLLYFKHDIYKFMQSTSFDDMFDVIRHIITSFTGYPDHLVQSFFVDFRKVLDITSKDVSHLSTMSVDDIKGKLVNFQLNLNKFCFAKNFKNYADLRRSRRCDWIKRFKASRFLHSIEVPGQYSKFSKPLVCYHSTIEVFDPTMQILDSSNCSSVLTIGDNKGKNHMLMVKVGTDLKTDQLVQHACFLMNELFKTSTTGSRLSKIPKLHTYEVIPVNVNMGMIFWIENTISLSGILKNEDANANDLLELSNASEIYKKLGTYKVLPNFMRSDECIQHFTKIRSNLNRDLFSIALSGYACSQKATISFKNQLAASFATMSISHWLVGIGDRGLRNVLINVITGDMVGVGVNCCFDGGTELSVYPDLVHFRLSTELHSLFLPCGYNGIIRETMVACLCVLREFRSIIKFCLRLFVERPTKSWLLYHASHSTENWETVSRNRFDRLCQKLDGGHPSEIMSQAISHNKTVVEAKVVEEYKQALMGRFSIRSSLPKGNLSVTDQVDALLEHSTDINLIARMPPKWDPLV